MNFLKNMKYSLKEYKNISLIHMKDWGISYIHGKDMIEYLQGKLTCNMNLIKKNKIGIGAHCNRKGKVISLFYIFMFKNGIGILERLSTQEKNLKVLKQNSIFSQVMFKNMINLSIIGIFGKNAKKIIYDFFNIFPNEENQILNIQENTLIYIKYPEERYILITTKKVKNKIGKNFDLYSEIELNKWISLDIVQGYPVIDLKNSEKFKPQSLNIKNIGGIDFEKGCYLGQEYIMKEEYRKENKHLLCWLINNTDKSLHTGDSIKVKKNDYYINLGKVLTVCRINNNMWIQAVINKNKLYNADKNLYDYKINDFSIKRIYI